MTSLPSARPKDVIAVLQKVGYVIDHQTGSHTILYRKGSVPAVVPLHNRDLKKGTLYQILRGARLTAEDFIRLK
jgi:predicted RNA binding protein YcfA (HicA-like mRNA interferase family)